MTIPLVESSSEDDFLNGLKFTDGDVSEVIGKMDRELRWISILVPKDYQNTLSSDTIDTYDSIFDNLTFDNLIELGHSSYCKTRKEVRTITLFEGRRNDLYLPFDDQDRDSIFFLRSPDKRKELYMRSVLIKDFRFNLPVLASIFEVTIIISNITSRKFIPDISRNNLDTESKKNINYMIGKAIHIGAANLLTLGTDEKQTLQNFINNFYDKKTEFEK